MGEENAEKSCNLRTARCRTRLGDRREEATGEGPRQAVSLVMDWLLTDVWL